MEKLWNSGNKLHMKHKVETIFRKGCHLYKNSNLIKFTE